MDSVKFSNTGRLTGSGGKPYPYGIRQEKSPDGESYAPLKDVTKELKRRKSSHYTTSILQDRGGTDPLSLINSLSYRITNFAGKTAGVSGGVLVSMDSKNNEQSLRLESGGNFISGDLKPNKPRFVPSRKHREVQGMVREQIKSLLSKWMKKNR